MVQMVSDPGPHAQPPSRHVDHEMKQAAAREGAAPGGLQFTRILDAREAIRFGGVLTPGVSGATAPGAGGAPLATPFNQASLMGHATTWHSDSANRGMDAQVTSQDRVPGLQADAADQSGETAEGPVQADLPEGEVAARMELTIDAAVSQRADSPANLIGPRSGHPDSMQGAIAAPVVGRQTETRFGQNGKPALQRTIGSSPGQIRQESLQQFSPVNVSLWRDGHDVSLAFRIGDLGSDSAARLLEKLPALLSRFALTFRSAKINGLTQFARSRED